MYEQKGIIVYRTGKPDSISYGGAARAVRRDSRQKQQNQRIRQKWQALRIREVLTTVETRVPQR